MLDLYCSDFFLFRIVMQVNKTILSNNIYVIMQVLFDQLEHFFYKITPDFGIYLISFFSYILYITVYSVHLKSEQ